MDEPITYIFIDAVFIWTSMVASEEPDACEVGTGGVYRT